MAVQFQDAAEERQRRLRDTFADLRRQCQDKPEMTALSLGWLIDYIESEAPEVGGRDIYEKALVGLEYVVAWTK